MRGKRRGGLLTGLALSGGILFGCTMQHEPPLAAPPAVAVAHGTVLVVRADRFAGPVFSERAQLVRDIDGRSGSETAPLVEAVVRLDDGRTVALTESPKDGLLPGQRVLVVDGAILRELPSAGQ